MTTKIAAKTETIGIQISEETVSLWGVVLGCLYLIDGDKVVKVVVEVVVEVVVDVVVEVVVKVFIIGLAKVVNDLKYQSQKIFYKSLS